jgi:hypothetical protein
MSVPAGYAHARCEALGVNTATSLGTTITASATQNSKGSWTSIGQTTFEWNSFIISVCNIAASNKVFDIGISDDNTNWWIIAPDLKVPGLKYADFIEEFTMPLRVPAGKYIGARCAASTASHTLDIGLVGSHSSMMGMPGYSRAVSLYTVGTSRGVAIDPGATTNTKGPWTELIASTPTNVDSIIVMQGQNADVNRTATARMLMDIGIGASGQEFAIVPNLFSYWTTTSDGPTMNWGPITVSIPAGSRISARAQCTDNTSGDRTVDVGVIGFVT